MARNDHAVICMKMQLQEIQDLLWVLRWYGEAEIASPASHPRNERIRGLFGLLTHAVILEHQRQEQFGTDTVPI